MSRNVGHLYLTYKEVGDLLRLPKGHKLDRVFDAPENTREVVVFRISGPSLPSVPDGGAIPVVKMSSEKSGKVEFKT